MFVIAITNQKGGVAKTTTAVNLAAGLALLEYELNPKKPAKVLFVQLDSQGDGTAIITNVMNRGKPEDYDGTGLTIADILLADQPPTTGDAIRHANIPLMLVNKGVYSLDYIPVNPETMAEASISIHNVDMRDQRLDLALQDGIVMSKYKYVIVDTPPGNILMIKNGLAAATHVIIPVATAGAGLRNLLDTFATVRKIQKLLNPDLKVLGILPSKCIMSRSETKLVLEELEKHYSELLFSPIIERAEISAAFTMGYDIFSSLPPRSGSPTFISKKEAAIEFGRFTKEVYCRLHGIRLSNLEKSLNVEETA